MSIGFVAPGYSVSEMDCFVALNIRLTGSSDIPLNLSLTAASDIALAGQDFVRVSRMPVTIYPGTSLSKVNIQLLNDDFVEKDPESFTVLLEPGEGLPTGVNIDSNATVIYIEDDDVAFTTQGQANNTRHTL